MPSTIDAQIESLKHKGVTFELMGEDAARRFLTDNSYFFKVTAYRHNYRKRPPGATAGEHYYEDLDFGHLVELSNIDFALSRLILSLALGVEHAMKVRMNQLLMEDPKASDHAALALRRLGGRRPLSEQIQKNAYTQALHDRCQPHPSIWHLWELLPFSAQSDLYDHYCDVAGYRNNYSSLLTIVRVARNAVSHGSCLLYDVNKKSIACERRGQSDVEVTRAALEMCGIRKGKRNKRQSYLAGALDRLVVHNYATVLLCHLEFVNSYKVLGYMIGEVDDLVKRIERNREAHFGQANRGRERNRDVNQTLKALVDVSKGYMNNAREKKKALKLAEG